jgi:hypothetical protein
MRQDRVVLPDQVAIDYWLGPIRPEDMPMIAARLLAVGHDTPALRLAAGFGVRDDPRDIRAAFQQALTELGVWLPDPHAAQALAGAQVASDLLAGRLPVEDAVRRLREIWDFDDVIYRVLPADLEDLVLMSWLHGGQEYELNGGDQRLLAAARGAASLRRQGFS